MSGYMEFTYLDDKPTVESAIGQAIGAGSTCWTKVCQAGTFDSTKAVGIVEDTIAEVRRIIASDLILLFDREGVATEWNDAIEAALQMVEAS